MNPPTDWRAALEKASRAVDRWEVGEARAALETARSLAAGWGDVNAVALANVLEARAALLTASVPRGPLVPLGRHGGDGGAQVRAATLRWAVEVAAASESVSALPELTPLDRESPVDLVVASALAGVLRFEDTSRRAQGVAGGRHLVGREDATGWIHLVESLEAEAQGQSGIAMVDLAIRGAEADQNRSLLWAALRLRASLGNRRGAHLEVVAARDRMRRLVEAWALTLPAADAASALSRPDRARIAAPEANADLTGIFSQLIDVALALEQERDSQRLVEIALDAAVRMTGAERGLLLLLDANGQHRVATTRYLDAGGKEKNELVGLSSTVAKRALSEREVVVSNDVRTDRRFSECASMAIEITSVLCAPIHARSELEGAIYLDRRRGGSFDRTAISAARTIGSMVASALLSARTISDLEMRTRELETARDDLAMALTKRTVERDDMSRRLANIEDVVPTGGDGMIGRAPAMLRLRRLIENVAASDAPVLVTGETGSGKELVARALHAASNRRDRPFVAVNCGALSESLLAAELFGAERGAYTSATASRPGLFVAADGGTLFLDEVGDMPPAMQTALLRVLETSEVRPVGATRVRKVDVRIISASHRDLLEQVRSGAFRDDLRYRLEVVEVHVPPLRERLEDLPELCEHFLADVRRRYNLRECRLAPDALAALSRRRWAGNIRELRHVLASAALTAASGTILPTDLHPERGADAEEPSGESSEALGPDGHAIRIQSIRRALRAAAGHRGQAAKLLGVSRSTFYRYLQIYGIDAQEFERTGPAKDDA